jgi:hypothetical protein
MNRIASASALNMGRFKRNAASIWAVLILQAWQMPSPKSGREVGTQAGKSIDFGENPNFDCVREKLTSF